MSWAAKRETTREEDVAYCLLGIFDVNMPMLYGEGAKAFLRLQAEIIRQSDDHTIFAWPIHRDAQPGLLADSPAAFENCGQMHAMSPRQGHSSYTLTNRGLSIRLMATPFTLDTYVVRLDCVGDTMPESAQGRLGMFLRRLDEDDQYARVKHAGNTFTQLKASTWDNDPSAPTATTRPVQEISVNVRQEIPKPTRSSPKTMPYHQPRIYGFRLATPDLCTESHPSKPLFKVSAANWNPQDRIMSNQPGSYGNVGYLDLTASSRRVKALKLGFDFAYNPVAFVATSGGLDERIHVFDRGRNQLNFGLDSQEAQWTLEERAQFPGIRSRSPLDVLAWSEVRRGFAAELKQHSGLWALRGDRVNGLDVKLGDWGALRIERGTVRGELVWDVFLDEVKESALRMIFR